MRGHGRLKDIAEQRVAATKKVQSECLTEDKNGANDADNDAGHPEQKYQTANNCEGDNRSTSHKTTLVQCKPFVQCKPHYSANERE